MEVDRIIQGDCLEVLKDMPDNSVDLVLTDPPYKVSQKYGGGVDADNLMAVSSILQVMPELSRILKPNRMAVIFYDNRILPYLFQATKGTDFVYRKQLYIYRRWGNAHRWIGWMQTTDPVCIFVNGYEKPFAPELKWRVRHDCYIKEGPEQYSAGHPAQKPLEPTIDIVAWLTDKGETILDPYTGSATACVAAKMLGRHYIGIDISEKYCEIARKRVEAAEKGITVKELEKGQKVLF